jgi:RNA-directed DNA polymerase
VTHCRGICQRQTREAQCTSDAPPCRWFNSDRATAIVVAQRVPTEAYLCQQLSSVARFTAKRKSVTGGRHATRVFDMPITPPTPAVLLAFRKLGSLAEVAAFLNTSPKRLLFNLYSSNRPAYRVFLLSKSSGGYRTIASPPEPIASFQRRILQCLTSAFRPRDPVHGFVGGRSVATNAAIHASRRLILNIDISDFFDSIHFGRVRGVFAARPLSFPPKVASVLAQICCRGGSLPQGACTSPILSNLVCRGVDRDLDRFARTHDCRYTRYADDITFSTDARAFAPELVAVPPTLAQPSPRLGAELLDVVQKHDFKLNDAKTRLRRAHERQEVTGLIVNSKVNVPRRFVRNLRSVLHDCEQRGLSAADQRFQGIDRKQRRGGTPLLIEHLRGKLDYLRMIRGGGDALYCGLAYRAQRVARLYPAGVPVWGAAARVQKLIESAVWIVVGVDAQGLELTQGSAFMLERFGLISAMHVFDARTKSGDPIHHWYAFSAVDPGRRYRITAIRFDAHADLALAVAAEAPATPAVTLCRSQRNMIVGDPIWVVGFPSWRTIADRIFRSPGHVSQTRIASCVPYIATTASVTTGNSGGPILDEDGRVVGVVTHDGTGKIAPNGGPAITHLDTLQNWPIRAL